MELIGSPLAGLTTERRFFAQRGAGIQLEAPRYRSIAMADLDLKPLPKLGGEDLEEIIEAIVSGYDLDDWSRALQFKWGLVLANYVDVRQGFYGVVADLVAWTERKGKTCELLALAFAENPGNENLQQLAAKYGLSQRQTVQKYNDKRPFEKPANLEALVNSHSRLVDYGRFLARLQDISGRICRVETPIRMGTGFLVAKDCVLTNFHVVEEVIANAALSDKVVCRFDFHKTGEGGAHATSRSYKLAANGIGPNSPYGQSDLTGTGEPRADELDYAALRLAEQVGSIPINGDRQRGWFDLVADSPVVAIRDFIMIPQHAAGEELKIAWGSVVEFPCSGNRVRYDTTTAGGSSGSPCFTADLDIVGLHHAAEPAHNPKYNQAVPLWLIARDLEAKHVRLADA